MGNENVNAIQHYIGSLILYNGIRELHQVDAIMRTEDEKVNRNDLHFCRCLAAAIVSQANVKQ